MSFTVDEGFGVSASLPLVVTNGGVFGSLLSAALTPSAAYLLVSPQTLGGLQQNESGTAQVRVDSTNLLAVYSPYAASVSVSAVGATNSPQTVPVTIVVRPKATVAVLPIALSFSVVAPVSGPFPAIPSQVFALQNTGPLGSLLTFRIEKLGACSDWLISFLPSSGSVAGGSSQTITVTVAPPEGMLQGTYTETLRVSGYSTNGFVDIPITLVIT
jgi:hypothetical protein